MAWSRCRSCGAVNDSDARSCYLCGETGLDTACPRCHHPLDNPVDTSCPHCGAAYGTSATRRGRPGKGNAPGAAVRAGGVS